MRALITGITGFAGSHLADYLLRLEGWEVAGIARWRSRTENIEHLRGKVELFECDLRDAFSVREVLRKWRPDRVYHLAAQSYVPMSWVAPSETLLTNIIGELNIFEGLRQEGMTQTRIQLACSSAEYGLVQPGEVPIKESNPLRPLSPYGVSKVAQDYLGYQYHKSYGQFIVRTRGFNHTGPRRGEVFVTSSFARQIAEVEKGRREPVVFVGNLDAVRDFTDVRDMVRGYHMSLEKCEPGEVYNICTGKGYRIREVLDLLLSLSSVKIELRRDPKRMRPSDVELLIGDNTKFVSQTGWQPSIPFVKTMEDLLSYWRERL
ncbi:MAG: GDP-mannose 4,6-dehydratase [candidate division WOR-3 bacterium]